MNMKLMLPMFLSAVMCGCAVSNKIVYVHDEHGQPIRDVQVISQYESVDAGMNTTNAEGRCCINMSRAIWLGNPKYLAFVKEGWQTQVIDFPYHRPFTIHLKPMPEPETAPTSKPKDEWGLPAGH